MKDIELLISSLVEEQFPSFYKEEGEMFIAFVKAYFEWLELENNITRESRNLMSYRDIDSTLTKFVENFQYKYLQGVPRQYTGDRRLLQKHIKEIYASKGTSRGLELLFRLLFNEDINVYFPGDDVIKPSDGDFFKPRYLEMQYSPYLQFYVNKLITGRVSGATAIVNDYRYFLKENNRFDVLYLSNITGDFQAGEEIVNETVLTEQEIEITESPIVRGSLSDIIIVDGGVGFFVGDTFTVDSFKNGTDAKAVITDIVQRAGFVTFDIRNGGYGFSNVSTLETAGFDDVLYSRYMPNIVLERTSADLTANGGSGTFTNNEIVEGNSSGASGRFVSESGGRVNLRRVEGNFSTGETISGATATRTFTGEDLVSEASFKVGHLLETQTRALSGVRIEEACNVAVSWYRDGTEVIVKHPFHCLRDNDYVVVKTSSDETALPANATTPVTIQLSDLDYSINSTAMYITANGHNYDGGDQIIIRSCSNNTLIPQETRFNVAVFNANVFFIPKTAAVANTGTVNINDYYTITGLNAGNTSGTATIDMTIDANNYGGFCDRAVLIEDGVVNDSLSFELPTSSMDINEAIKFGDIEFGKIADEKAFPSGLSSVFGGEGYRTNVLVSITDPIIYGLRIKGAPRELTGLVTIDNTGLVTGTDTRFTKELAVGSEVYSEQWPSIYRTVSSISSDTVLQLNDAFRDTAGNALSDITPEPLLAVTYWGKIDFPATDSVDEADVFGVAGFGKGAANRLAVIDSGIGYQDGETLTLYSTKDSTKTISAIAVALEDGFGEGYFKSNRGFISSNKYIHDNNYYQEFSYEVQSGISFDKYSAILKEIWHPAGVSKFGRVVVNDVNNLEAETVDFLVDFGRETSRSTSFSTETIFTTTFNTVYETTTTTTYDTSIATTKSTTITTNFDSIFTTSIATDTSRSTTYNTSRSTEVSTGTFTATTFNTTTSTVDFDTTLGTRFTTSKSTATSRTTTTNTLSVYNTIFATTINTDTSRDTNRDTVYNTNFQTSRDTLTSTTFNTTYDATFAETSRSTTIDTLTATVYNTTYGTASSRSTTRSTVYETNFETLYATTTTFNTSIATSKSTTFNTIYATSYNTNRTTDDDTGTTISTSTTFNTIYELGTTVETSRNTDTSYDSYTTVSTSRSTDIDTTTSRSTAFFTSTSIQTE